MKLKPNSNPQETFLKSPADVAVYGGGAGGGKSFAILLEPMRHAKNPDFGAVLFRRTSPQITNEGGLWDEAGKIYPLVGGVPKIGDLEYAFASGMRVSFRHLQHEKNKYDWQGSQVPLLGFDELTHFSESQFFYMLSRNRSTCGVRPYVRATTNPDAASWVKRFLSPWVNRKDPDPAASGEIRWFVRVNGKIVWGRTPGDLREQFPGVELMPKSCTFVRATVYDNVDLLRKDPGYLANLMAQTPVERARLLDGDWDVVNEGLVYPDFGSCVVEPEDWPETIEGRREGGIDWGWNNPFAALGAVLDRDDVLWVGWERYGSRITLTEHSKALPRDGTRWWADPAGADQINELRQAGHFLISASHHGQKPLEDGIAKVAARIRTGRLKVKGSLGFLIGEAGKYRYEKQTEKPVDEENHACFVAGTQIATRDGDRPIETIKPGDMVLTRAGWKTVEVAGVTGRESQVVCVEFSNGSKLTGTPNHPVFTQNRGWIPLNLLRDCDTITCIENHTSAMREDGCGSTFSPRQSGSCSTASHIADTRTQRSWNSGGTSSDNTVIAFTVPSGNSITDQSQKGTTSTTRTATRSTTRSQTWNAFHRSITSQVTWTKRGGTACGSMRTRRFAKGTANGPRQTQENNGSTATRGASVNSHGRTENLNLGNATNAEAISSQSRSETTTDFAPTNASRPSGETAASTTKTACANDADRLSGSTDTQPSVAALVRVLSVSGIKKKASVFNLQVADQPEYFANGILVHNCAALRYMIVGIDRNRSVQDAEPPESEEAILARKSAEAEAAEAAQREWQNIDNPAFWE